MKNPRRNVLDPRVETREDAALLKIARKRKQTLVRSTALTHDQVWANGARRRVPLKRRRS